MKYLLDLLSHDKAFDCHLKLKDNDYIESEDGFDIAKKIQEVLESNTVFEYTTEDYEVVPVVNPSVRTIHNNGARLRPVSESSLRFLSKFGNFLDSSERIYILQS
jgi:hypothetical protein